MQTTKPFLKSLERNLRNRLPPDEFNQVMDEALWEFENSDHGLEDENGKDLDSLIRLSSLCVSFYRAMTHVGIEAGIAFDSMDKAGENLDWKPVEETTAQKCSLANYFRAKNALGICKVTFCKSCPESVKGCGLIGGPAT
jgi:hypothetical protein